MRFIPLLLGVSLVLGCSTRKDVYRQETFAIDTPFAQMFNASPAQTCEAARRTLLSQGYIVAVELPERISGAKVFQPNEDEHMSIEFSVSCVAMPEDQSTAYANAVQTRYQLKTSPNSFGLSAPVIGALSLPFGSKAEDLIKTGAATITDGNFYARFWSLMATHAEAVPIDSGD